MKRLVYSNASLLHIQIEVVSDQNHTRPYYMDHIIWTILYGPYHMDHIIWTISWPK